VRSSSRRYFDDVADQWDELRSEFFADSVRVAAVDAVEVEAGALAADPGAGSGFVTEELLARGPHRYPHPPDRQHLLGDIRDWSQSREHRDLHGNGRLGAFGHELVSASMEHRQPGRLDHPGSCTTRSSGGKSPHYGQALRDAHRRLPAPWRGRRCYWAAHDEMAWSIGISIASYIRLEPGQVRRRRLGCLREPMPGRLRVAKGAERSISRARVHVG
jgi:hypothetical protein